MNVLMPFFAKVRDDWWMNPVAGRDVGCRVALRSACAMGGAAADKHGRQACDSNGLLNTSYFAVADPAGCRHFAHLLHSGKHDWQRLVDLRPPRWHRVRWAIRGARARLYQQSLRGRLCATGHHISFPLDEEIYPVDEHGVRIPLLEEGVRDMDAAERGDGSPQATDQGDIYVINEMHDLEDDD